MSEEFLMFSPCSQLEVAYDNDQTSKRRKTTRARFDSEAHTSALKRAKELQANLSPEHPSFIKQLQRSHVMQKFKPGVPVEFRKLHLPTDDVEVILENECGEGYKMKFLGGTEGKFVSGWKKFSVAHNLVEGDIVVFHLLRPCYFKVYIIRANDPTGVQRSSPLSNPTLEPVSSHSGMEEIHSSDMEAYPISACDAEFDTITNVAYDNYQTSKCCMAKRGGISSEAHALALKRAKELQRNLSSEHPSFVKQMQRSSVDQKPMMTVPSEFCGLHLPKHDVEVTLEDESGERYVVKLIPREIKRFRGGWKRFSAAHKLLEGDVVVFHMLRPCYFKVYITRANDPTVVGSPDLASSSNVHGGKNKRKYDAADTKGRELASQLDTVQEGSSLLSNPNLELEPPHFSMEELHLSDMDAPPSSERDADYKNFRIVVNGEVVDQELSESTRFNYYKLCCSRKSALHHQLLENVGRTLAAGIITGTLEVADAIRTCTLSATDADFAMWDKTLEGFKNFGMDVGFLSDRLKQTASVASDLRKTEEFERYVEAKNKRNCIEKELKSIEEEMKIMEVDLQKFNAHLQEEANAPW